MNLSKERDQLDYEENMRRLSMPSQRRADRIGNTAMILAACIIGMGATIAAAWLWS